MSYGTNAPQGFQAVSTLGAYTTNFRTFTYEIDPASATAIFNGDAVAINAGTGYLNVGVAGAPLIGVFAGVSYTLPNAAGPNGNFNPIRMWPGSVTVQAGTTINAFVIVDPATIYNVQAAPAVVGGYVRSNIGSKCNFVAGAGNTSTQNSTQTLGAVATTATNNFTLLALADGSSGGVQNAWGINYNNVLVTLNSSLFSPNVAGI